MARKQSPQQYIEHLQEVNRAKKIRELEDYRKREDQIKREQNFHVHFSGANQLRLQAAKLDNERWTPAIKPHGYAKIHRRKWDKPETPLIFKESPEETMDRRRWNAFRHVGQAVAQRTTEADSYNLASRINNLSHEQRSRVLKVLEQCEALVNY